MQIKKYIKKEVPFFIVSLGFILQVLFFYIPVLLLVIASFIKYLPDKFYLSLENFAYFFKPVYISIILKSILFAFLNAVLCFIIGFPIAYFLAFKSNKYKNFYLFLLILPFWTNFLLHIYSWSYILGKSGPVNNLLIYFGIVKEPLMLFNSIFAIIIVMLYCYLPFMILPIYSVLERLNRSVLEASADLGASTWTTLIRIVLPLSVSGVFSGFFLVLVPSFAEFAIPSLVGGDKYIFVGSIITQYVLSGNDYNLGIAFTLIAMIIFMLFIALIYLAKNTYKFMRLRLKDKDENIKIFK